MVTIDKRGAIGGEQAVVKSSDRMAKLGTRAPPRHGGQRVGCCHPNFMIASRRLSPLSLWQPLGSLHRVACSIHASASIPAHVLGCGRPPIGHSLRISDDSSLGFRPRNHRRKREPMGGRCRRLPLIILSSNGWPAYLSRSCAEYMHTEAPRRRPRDQEEETSLRPHSIHYVRTSLRPSSRNWLCV